MSDDSLTATVQVDDAELEREVCGLRLQTRTEGNNVLSLAGGIEVRVDDEFARTVAEEYFSDEEVDE